MEVGGAWQLEWQAWQRVEGILLLLFAAEAGYLHSHHHHCHHSSSRCCQHWQRRLTLILNIHKVKVMGHLIHSLLQILTILHNIISKVVLRTVFITGFYRQFIPACCVNARWWRYLLSTGWRWQSVSSRDALWALSHVSSSIRLACGQNVTRHCTVKPRAWFFPQLSREFIQTLKSFIMRTDTVKICCKYTPHDVRCKVYTTTRTRPG